MNVRIDRRWILAVCLAAGAVFSACSAAESTAPHQRDLGPLKPARDDDSTTCRSGYTIVNGHVYCDTGI